MRKQYHHSDGGTQNVNPPASIGGVELGFDFGAIGNQNGKEMLEEFELRAGSPGQALIAVIEELGFVLVRVVRHASSVFVRRSGIRGFVLKEDAGEELVPALNAVLAGGRYLSRGVAGTSASRDLRGHRW